MNVTLPDGTVLTDIPEGTTKAQLLAKLKANGYDVSGLEEAPAKPAQKESVLDAPNAIASGFNRGVVRLAGLPVDTMANVIDLGKAAIGAPYTAITGKAAPDALQPVDRAEVIGSGDWLLKQAAKNKLTSASVNPHNPEYEGGYLQALGGAMAGAASPSQAAKSIAGGLAGKVVGEQTGSVPLAIAASMSPGLAGSGRVQPTPTAKSSTLRAAQDEGYVVPPTQAGAGWVSGRLESIAGKAALNQDAIQRNQAVTNRLAASGAGLPAGEEITPDALARLRADAGRLGYGPIDRIGDIPTTPRYANDIIAMENRIGNPTSRISSLRYPAVSELATELLPTKFTGSDVNNLIKQLRESGNKNANIPYGGDQSAQKLGQAQLGGAKALENLVDEHLLQFGPSNVVPNLQAARQAIAKSHTLEKALNPATGDVNAQVFGQRVKVGKPVAGEQELIGRFAAAYPQLTKPAAGSPTPGVSALEAIGVPAAAAVGSAATGNASGMIAGGLPLLRAPVRNLLLSKWYQQQFARQPSKRGRLSEEDQGALARAMIASGMLDQQ